MALRDVAPLKTEVAAFKTTQRSMTDLPGLLTWTSRNTGGGENSLPITTGQLWPRGNKA